MSIALDYIACALIGYLFGCLNPAFWISAAKGRNIRTLGNGNPGASNMTLQFGLVFGGLVALLDIGKAAAAFCLARLLFPDILDAGLIAGLAAVLGHMFPFWMKFRGGKGFACFLGTSACLSPRFTVAALILSLLLVLFSDYIIAATFCFTGTLPVYTLVFIHDFLAAGCITVVSLIIMARHIENIKNIRAGTEPSVRKALFRKNRS